MFKDPIVVSVHKTRERIAKENNYDLKLILNQVKENEKKSLKHFVDKEDFPKAG